MPNLNQVLLMGNLTREPELRELPSGTKLCQIGLAINHNYTDAAGQRQQDTTFLTADAWGRTGEVIAQYFHKGDPIFIEGRLHQDRWQDQDGQNRSRLKIVVEGFQFVATRRQSEGPAEPPPPAQAATRPPARSPTPPPKSRHTNVRPHAVGSGR